MAHNHGNAFIDYQLLSVQDEESFNDDQTIRPSDISGFGIDPSQDCHPDASYQLQQGLNLFKNLNFNETESPYPGDWYTTTFDGFGQTTLPSSKVDASADSVDPYISHDQSLHPELATSIVESVVTTSIVPHDPRPQVRNHDLSKEQSSTIRAYPKRAARTKKNKGTTAKYLTQVERHSRVLERNRVAALKCRLKKKEWTACLEEDARDLQQKRNALTQSVARMKDELLHLKGEILRHSGCNNPQIKAYLDLQASKLASTINTYSYHTTDSGDVFPRI